MQSQTVARSANSAARNAFFNMANRFGGVYAGAVNRLPEMSERVGIKNAERSLRAVTPSGQQNSQPTRLLRGAQISSFGGNVGGAHSILEQAIQQKMATSKISRAQAMSQIRSAVMAQNPLHASGGNLKGPALTDALSRMTGRQLGAYKQGKQGFERFVAALPPKQVATSPRSIFKSHIPKAILRKPRKLGRGTAAA